MTSTQLIILIVMMAYMVIIIGYGFYIGRKVKSSSDFAIAGRKLPGWAAALSERATGESGWALLGLPGAAYATGLTEMWTAFGCASGIILGWIFIALRFRSEAEKYQADSFMEYLSRRHGETGKYIRTIGSSIIAFFFFFYIGAQFIGGGKALYQILDIDIYIGLIIIFVFVVPYTIYGGFQSVVYTDVIQALIMLVTLIVAPVVGLIYIANHPDVYASTIGSALQQAGSDYTSLTGAVKGLGAGVVIAGGFSWMFGYLGGMPQLAVRFMAIENHKQAVQARNIAISWTVFAYAGALLLGWIGLAIFGPQSTVLMDREAIMPAVLFKIFHPIIAAILITGVFAAIVSTANSLLILSATELSDNILIPMKWFKNSGIKKLTLSRIVTTVLSLAAFAFAVSMKENLIYNIVKYVWAGIGDTFSVVIILTLYWKKFHARAALATIIGGILFTIVWLQTGMEKQVSCLVMTFVFSLITAIVATYVWRSNKIQA